MLFAALNFDSNEAKTYIALSVGILGLAYFWLRPGLKKKRNDPLEKSPFSSISQQRATERQMQNLLVEMAEMARQISAQLDTRAARLDALIGEADKKIIELNRANAQSPHPVGAFDRSAAGPAVRMQSAADAAASAADCIIPPVHDITPVRDEPAIEPARAVDPRHAEIYALADDGTDAAEIARRLNRPRGEIELILALRGPPAGTDQRAAG